MVCKKTRTKNMLIQFTCSNHRSIKDLVTFSMAASTDSSFEENLLSFGKGRYLRCAEIYGANASGKTSLLDAMQLMSFIVNESHHFNEDQLSQCRVPHKMEKDDTPTSFGIIFEKNGTKYSYGFSYTDNKIIDEYLFYWPGMKKAKIFERDEKGFDFSPYFKKDAENCNDGRVKKYKLLLSIAKEETNIPEIADVYDFFQKDLVFFDYEYSNWFNYSAKQLRDNPKMKRLFLNFMHMLGVDIKDCEVVVDRSSMKQEMTFSRDESTKNASQYKDDISVYVVYDKMTVNLKNESSGIRNLFQFLCPVIDIFIKDKVLFCDELERSLHPAIVSRLVQFFNSKSESSAQLIFTTHNTDLLCVDEIRRDQIWFTEMKKKGRSTTLYSLAEIKDVRKDENFKKGYLSGRYGAIPIMNESFFERFVNEL